MSNESDIRQLRTQVTKLIAEMSAVQTRTHENIERIEATESEIDAIDITIADHETRITTLEP